MGIQFIENKENPNIYFANAESLKDKLDLGALLSRYSRTHESLKTLYKQEFENNPDKGPKFYERNFGQYGDESISELVPVGFAVCIEFVPKLWAGRIFHYRALSGIEKSSRYMKTLDYYKWKDMPQEYINRCDKLMAKFNKHYTHTKIELTEMYGDNKPATAKAIEAKTLDYSRYLLPLSTLTSFGVVANLRSWLNILGKEAVKYHNDTLYQNEMINPLAQLFIEHFPSIFSKEKYVKVGDDAERMENSRMNKIPDYYDQEIELIDSSSRDTIYKYRDFINLDRAKKQKAHRLLENIILKFYIPKIDFGTLFDFQRHRHLNVLVLEPIGGYSQSEILSSPLGTNTSLTALGNLREWIHCVELRTQETGHFKYRKIFQDIAILIAQQIGFPKEKIFPYANWKSDKEIGLGRRESELKLNDRFGVKDVYDKN